MEPALEFEQSLQEFAATLVLVDAGDPGSYQKSFNLLDELAAHRLLAAGGPAAERIKGIQQALEECLFDSGVFPEKMGLVDEHLRRLRAWLDEGASTAAAEDGAGAEPGPLGEEGADCREEVPSAVEAGGGTEAPVEITEVSRMGGEAQARIVEVVGEAGEQPGPVGEEAAACREQAPSTVEAGGGPEAPFVTAEAARAGAEAKAQAAGAGEAPRQGAPPQADPRTAPARAPEPAVAPPPMSEDRELVEDFLLEAGESLDTIEVEIIHLEVDPRNPEVLNAIFRPFHTIKGVSGFLNLDDIHRLTHAVEDLLDGARRQEFVVSGKEIEIVLGAVDLLKRLLAAVRDALHGQRVEADLPAKVNAFLERLAAGAGDALSADGPAPAEAARTESDPVPPVAAEEGAAAGASPPPESGENRRIGEILVEQGKCSPEEVESALKVQKGAEEAKESGGQRAATVKVDQSRLDHLVNMVGELVIAQTLIQQNPNVRRIADHRLTRDFSQLTRITSELRNTAMGLRMVPIGHTFQKMIRLVRDLCRKSGKSVQLTMSGEDTEIDRTMVDMIYEPLVHMVRNSVDHGIEPAARRLEAGKPETGSLHLKACHRGGNVVIEIQDDGQGLNCQKILEKARARGLVGLEETPAEHEIHQLVFCPGFSTAEQITDVSGRGVGMDVVKRSIEQLRGKVEIRSVVGQGANFVIMVPLTLAIIDGIVVGVGRERFILPTGSIHEAFCPKAEDYLTVAGRGELIRFRGGLLPLLRLHRLFSIATDKESPWEALVVVVESEGERCGVLVDSVLEKQEVVIKSLGEGFAGLEGVAGGSILGDGRVGLILDVNGIFRLRNRAETSHVN